jgi:hypothetical protein
LGAKGFLSLSEEKLHSPSQRDPSSLKALFSSFPGIICPLISKIAALLNADFLTIKYLQNENNIFGDHVGLGRLW